MGVTARIAGAVGAAAGLAAAGGAVRVAQRRRTISRRAGEAAPFGSLHSPARTVVADDGVPLHVEVDEADSDLTIVFVHGYALNLDCWHFQRAAYRGLVRTVFYDQRSHGRSGRGEIKEGTIDQLGRDLKSVIDAVVPDGPVVVVGHSMGGMTIVALAEQLPELIGTKVTGAALISTTAGGLDPSRLFFPMVPSRLSSSFTGGAIRTLARGHRMVDGVRRLGRGIATVATDTFAFGDEVPASYVEFVDDMLSATPFQVVAEFFPGFRELDKFDYVANLSGVPTTVICGTVDRLTSIGHSRKLHSRIPGSTLVECQGAGHMVILERHGQVNAALDQLLSSARGRAHR
ncbi:alpha/beta fold hydrolase [Nocardioides sp. Kera G14]|uniref:alpha/beta fold hydrolase n=1 Tax=Nocardioides sp. Kera G14 TaxID=2884264 RepID=UPI001D118EDB|nr:alpha/beta hydrolase [Nocardioides sp. Kera G14]UDY24311.1 alpha/beta hydrolase [Nocardioides sp. Kera G14]